MPDDLRSDETKAVEAAISRAVARERERCAAIVASRSGYYFCRPDEWSGCDARDALITAIRSQSVRPV